MHVWMCMYMMMYICLLVLCGLSPFHFIAPACNFCILACCCLWVSLCLLIADVYVFSHIMFACVAQMRVSFSSHSHKFVVSCCPAHASPACSCVIPDQTPLAEVAEFRGNEFICKSRMIGRQLPPLLCVLSNSWMRMCTRGCLLCLHSRI